MTQQEQFPSEPEKSVFTRRQFIGAGVITAAALALPKIAQAEGSHTAQGTTIIENCDTKIPVPIHQEFQELSKIKSAGGKLNHTINTRIASLQIPGQQIDPEKDELTYQSIEVRTYNCHVPGEALYIQPGDELNINFNNQFPVIDQGECHISMTQDNYAPGCFNTTNLHFHGLHVSPEMKNGIASDSVLISVNPGKSQQYTVKLPDFHAPGTHWYHSHLHGSSGLQVSNGLVGAIIIPEPKENEIVPSELDKVWLVQEVIGGLAKQTDIYPQESQTSVRATFLVNGLYQPTIKVNKKQWQRWRFINGGATPRSFTNLKLVKNFKPENFDKKEAYYDQIVPMYLIAVDGISFYGKNPQSTGTKGWDLAPGNRADFILWLPDSIEDGSTLSLIKDVWTDIRITKPELLATIKVSTSAENGNDPDPTTNDYLIPGKLPDYLQPIEYQELFTAAGLLKRPVQDVRFSIPLRAGKDVVNKYGKYAVNEHQYGVDGYGVDEDKKIIVGVNTAEIWTIKNVSGGDKGTGGSPHPFHIHVNPFQVVGDKIDPNGPDDSSNWRWYDTIAVARASSKIIVQRFPDYYGEYVLHCHILIHEDLGMMQGVEIKNDGTGIEPFTPLSKCKFTPSAEPQYVTMEQIVKR
ncbi:multicopper oxidase domain-containing protein [Sphaerospermopsis sp. LEGE 00249]|jgi:L-ascorbate oxidase|uniref:multicopper oxidase family protein n=1 Tax=Sphaerospermopsis sp. LEGE 00249 TaxID=1380707 RepID=UPI00164DC93E|nr:multicopper oxidase domain-containing protein [Sphaerospermopsis sp. LEGE 00249]MBC5793695.1 multicopper oxidase domain-containing protein [Sphaerospermopsis sp. LEGE 00249]